MKPTMLLPSPAPILIDTSSLAFTPTFCPFFLKAEDGIRYHCVTGVQTCALPISGDTNNQKERTTRTAEMGRVKKISGDPWDIMRLWRKAASAISPSTRARTIGAIG